MRHIVLPATALMLIVGTGAAHRWRDSKRVDEARVLTLAAERLRDVPQRFGDWVGEDLPMDEAQLRRGQIEGHLSRSYTNTTNGATVLTLLVCGAPGPISVHTPDACFKGNGYELAKPAQRHQLEGERPAEVRAGDFLFAASPVPHGLRVLWTWNEGSGWRAPDQPRLAYAGNPFLYKAYIVRPSSNPGESLEGDACLSFLSAFIPVLEKSLFPQSSSGESGSRALLP